jgi:hypothetical protein
LGDGNGLALQSLLHQSLRLFAHLLLGYFFTALQSTTLMNDSAASAQCYRGRERDRAQRLLAGSEAAAAEPDKQISGVSSLLPRQSGGLGT